MRRDEVDDEEDEANVMRNVTKQTKQKYFIVFDY